MPRASTAPGRGPGQLDVLPRPGESVLHTRATRSSASLLSLSMSTSMNSLGSMRKLRAQLEALEANLEAARPGGEASVA